MSKRSKRVFAACTQGATSRPVGTPLALDPRALGVTYDVSEPEKDYRYGATVERSGEVAIVRVCGPLEQRASWFDGYDSCSWRVGIAERFAMACADGETSSVVLVMDSPGGECAGLFECVKSMRASAAASGKRVVAYVGEAAYSAAYALACVAPEIVLPESGGVGSIGVIAELVDFVGMNEKYGINVAIVSAGAHKADGHPDMPISDQAIEVVGARVAQLAEQFFASVSESRPLSTEEIAGLEAACFYGAEAVDAGLADGVMGLAELIGSLASATDQGAMAAPGTGEQAMKRTGSIAAIAALATAHDALSAPLVGATPASVIGAEAYKKTETSEVTEETESQDEDAGTTTTTTTTTTTESETTGKDPDASEDEDGGDEDESEETEDAASATAASSAPSPAASRASTTRDVLAAVRRITGAATMGAQIGALEAMSASAARADKLAAKLARLEAKSRTAAVATTVDKAIRMGKLTPAQRTWAIATGTKDPAILDGFLAAAPAVVAPEPVRMPATRAPSGSATVAAVSGLTPEETRIAKQLGIDPGKLAAFKTNGGAVPTITH